MTAARAEFSASDASIVAPLPYKVAAFYHFTTVEDPSALRVEALKKAAEYGVLGTMITAREGVNATVAASPEGADAFLTWLRLQPGLQGVQHKVSFSAEPPFSKMRVKVRPEIVRMDVPDLDPVREAGRYVEAEEWDALLADPSVPVIDTRNAYETPAGMFVGAIDPGTRYFREFPEWAEAWAKTQDKSKTVAMYCTGGIRCEKSTALMKRLGFEDVVHLRGGILQYLEDTGNRAGRWQGSCFVFDSRAGVDAELTPARAPCESCGAGCSADDLKYGPLGRALCAGCAGRI